FRLSGGLLSGFFRELPQIPQVVSQIAENRRHAQFSHRTAVADGLKIHAANQAFGTEQAAIDFGMSMNTLSVSVGMAWFAVGHDE
ncbi:hypothetical protein LS46_26125, partial [Salmonella enterica]|nr:hypothetical protein [Salmonella enterica]EBO3736792.1 hypothetical protein [Salmonella enterica]